MTTRIPSALRLGLFALLTTAATATAQTVWSNTSGGSWDTPENWSNGVPALSTTTNLNTLASPYSVNFNTALGFDYVGLLTVGNSATLNVNAALAARGAGGATPLTVASGGVVNINSGGTLTTRKAASGAIGASISGTINVNGGALLAQTDSGTGKRFEVNSGGSLVLNSGSATFTDGGFRIYTGANLEVNGGTFTSSVFGWYNGATIKLSLGDDFVPLTINGDLTRFNTGAGAYTLSLLNAGFTPGATYTLINFVSTGFSLANITLNTSIPGTLSLNTNSLTYTVTAVPEPSTVALGVGLLGLTAGRLWKRRRLRQS